MRRSEEAPSKNRVKRAAARKSTSASPSTSAASAVFGAPKQQLVYELSRSFFELLLMHRNYYTSAIADEKLAPMQSMALHHLMQRDYTMRELANAAMLEPSNLTGIIDKLEARDLVTRREASGDRRSKIVSLTAQGLALCTRMRARFSEPAPWMVALTTQDQKRLLEIVRTAVEYEKSLQPPSSRTPRAVSEVDAPRPAPPRAQGKRTKK